MVKFTKYNMAGAGAGDVFIAPSNCHHGLLVAMGGPPAATITAVDRDAGTITTHSGTESWWEYANPSRVADQLVRAGEDP